jgi:hypothetical protein
MHLKTLFKATESEIEAFKEYMQETGYVVCADKDNKKSPNFSQCFYYFRDNSGQLDINYELVCMDGSEGPTNYIGIRFEDI